MEQYFNETLSQLCQNINYNASHDGHHHNICDENLYHLHLHDGISSPLNALIKTSPYIPSSAQPESPSMYPYSSPLNSHSDQINHHQLQQHCDITLNDITINHDNNQLSSGEGTFMDLLMNLTNSLFLTKVTCISIVLAYKLLVYLVFGKLRTPEQLYVRNSFRDYIFKKIPLIVILEAKDYHERLPWAIWYTAAGSILLLAILCRDRFEYLSASPSIKNWSILKIYALMGLLFLITMITTSIVLYKQPTTTNGILLLTDSMYTLTFVTSVIWRFIVLTYDMRTNSLWENRATIIYYSDLITATILFTISFMHYIHLLVLVSLVPPFKCWCLFNMRQLVLDTRRRYRRHVNYRSIVQLMETNFPMASQEEMDKNCDDCAICWDEMRTARKLPCGHLFHHSCLRSWLEQDTSCPTCRTSLKGHDDLLIDEDEIDDRSESEEEFIEQTNRQNQRNHFFRFDSSRYTNNRILSWLPTISIEGFM